MTTYIPKWTVGLLCFIAAAVMFISWLLAAACDPSWSFGTMTLSTLGVSEVDSAKTLFNVGFCMLGGALLIVIGALYLFTKKSRLLHALYAILIIAGGIGLICIGGNPKDVNEDLHCWIAGITCAIIGVLYILSTAEAWMSKRYLVAAVLTSGVVLAALLGIAQLKAEAETAIIVYFLLLLVYYGITWSTKKNEAVITLYGSEVKI